MTQRYHVLEQTHRFFVRWPSQAVANQHVVRSTAWEGHRTKDLRPRGEKPKASGDLCVCSLVFLMLCGALPSLAREARSPCHESDSPQDVVATRQIALVKQTQPDPLDWVYCRGPEFNGTSRETGLVDNWNPQGGPGSNVAWKRDDLGGRSTPTVMNGRLYTLVRAEPGTPREGEKVVCIDAKTGETLWENRFNVYLSDVPDTRVGWSSVVGDPLTGYVYALGVCGYFQCLDGETGKTIWQVPLHERFGLLSTYGGRTNFPIICDELVIVSAIVIGWGDMAKPTHRFLGFDKMTGDVVWINGTRPLPYDTNYSAPSLAILDGQKALVVGSGDGAVWAMQPRTGQPIWHFSLSRRGLDVAPLVVGDVVYMGHSQENTFGTTMGAVVAIGADGHGDISESGELWRAPRMMAGRAATLLIDDRLWVFDDGAKLYILDAATGKPVTRKIPLGTQMRANPLYADGKVYALTMNGRWYILQPDGQSGAKVLQKGRLDGEEVYGSPICSHGRIYIPTTGGIYCLFDESKRHGVTRMPAAPAETNVELDQQPAHVQVVPADVLIRPGQTQQFSVRLFNARGQFLRTADAQFQVDGLGVITSDGNFTAPPDGHVATTVTATVKGLRGIARVRIVPSLPWYFDFEDIPIDATTNIGEPPISWVGARYRHVVREVDGNQVMVKVTTIPKGTRSRSWMGQSDLHDYTIQADVRGAEKDGKLPDIGLIAQGYTLDLKGASQKLEIRTWVTQLRMAQTVDFPWEPNRWYTMKLRASLEGGRAILKGKVWPRGTQEPAEWTLEATDSSPNRAGSPGLWGNATDAELYLDNLHVTAN